MRTRCSLSLTLRAAVLAAVMIAPTLPLQPASASASPWGTVLVAGADWAGADATLGDLNVYSNGGGNQDQVGRYGLDYECVELAIRWEAVRYGEAIPWGVQWAYQMYDKGPLMPLPLRQLPNGGGVPPQYGDLLVFDHSGSNISGHVAVVSGTGPGYVDIVEQNAGNTGRNRLPISGSYMPSRSGLPVRGWLRAAAMAFQGPGGVILDAAGVLHGWGGASVIRAMAVAQGQTLRGVARVPGMAAGYVVDGQGDVIPFGGEPSASPTATWPGQDVARGIVVRRDGTGGYVLDEWGGVHPFGTAPALPPTLVVTRGTADVARGIALRPDGVSGYVLLSGGDLQPFGGAPQLQVSAQTWSGDMMVGLTIRSDGQGGYVVDRRGALHPYGDAGSPTTVGTKSGAMTTTAAATIIAATDTSGWLVTTQGALIPYGGATPMDTGLSLPGTVVGAA